MRICSPVFLMMQMKARGFHSEQREHFHQHQNQQEYFSGRQMSETQQQQTDTKLNRLAN